ncbi:MAG: oxidoreductase [Actinomycetota bacterium]|nr:oxidoreductase [Actinomycetota bacterium]
MGFSDSFRRFFNRGRTPDLGPLRTFAAERKGVEGYIEPQTATQPLTLLLVDRHGDSMRGAIRGPRDAKDFCAQASIPLYDAAVIGYPQRMVDFERRGGGPGKDALDEQIADLERRLQESD